MLEANYSISSKQYVENGIHMRVLSKGKPNENCVLDKDITLEAVSYTHLYLAPPFDVACNSGKSLGRAHEPRRGYHRPIYRVVSKCALRESVSYTHLRLQVACQRGRLATDIDDLAHAKCN